MPTPRVEPVKYIKNPKGNWVITPEWKKWVKEQKVTPKKPKEVLTVESHKPVWKEVANAPSGKRIYFCTCMRAKGYYTSCGAAAVQQSRTSSIIEVLKPRFE